MRVIISIFLRYRVWVVVFFVFLEICDVFGYLNICLIMNEEIYIKKIFLKRKWKLGFL